MRGKLSLVVGAVLALAACGGGDSPTGPSTPNLNGAWRISWTNMSGGGASCSTSSIRFALSQSGTTFTGSSSDVWTLTCRAGGFTDSESFVGAVISNGNINGNAITFNMATADMSNTGTLSGNTISGTSTWRIDTGTGIVILTGNWAAVRQ